jgi:hypothetical protein
VFAELRANSISIHGLEVAQLSQAARELQIGIVIGINERIEQDQAPRRSITAF